MLPRQTNGPTNPKKRPTPSIRSDSRCTAGPWSVGTVADGRRPDARADGGLGERLIGWITSLEIWRGTRTTLPRHEEQRKEKRGFSTPNHTVQCAAKKKHRNGRLMSVMKPMVHTFSGGFEGVKTNFKPSPTCMEFPLTCVARTTRLWDNE